MDDKSIARALDLGDALERELQHVNQNPIIAPLVLAARRAAIEATRELVGMDFTLPSVLPRALALQQAIHRFVDLKAWIDTTRERARAAFDCLDPAERDEVMTLLHGPQTRELNDA
jgi:hypothetical protein